MIMDQNSFLDVFKGFQLLKEWFSYNLIQFLLLKDAMHNQVIKIS